MQIIFIKSKDKIWTKEELNKNISWLIPDADTPNPIPADGKIMPLSLKSFPNILSKMTAQEAGRWAIRRCKDVGWEISPENIESCLVHLESDC